jgi:ribosome maturation factor RimP
LEFVRRPVEALGYELVGVELHGRGGRGTLLRIYIDSAQGITVDDCGEVSQQVSGVLDVEDPIKGHYDLEVSSPGLDRPLFTKDHFRRFCGHKASVKLRAKIEGRRKIVGTLVSVGEAEVVIDEESESFTIAFESIDSARLVPEL